MIREQLTTDLSATACRSKEAVGRWQADTASRTNNLGFFALRKSPVNYTQSRGAVLLIAILVASVALAVGLGVYNRTYKELLFASYWKQTQVGFSAADAGLECAMYWDTHPPAGNTNFFPTPFESAPGPTVTKPFSCFGQSISWVLDTGSPSGGVATSSFFASVANGCANITITKSTGGSHPLSPMTPATVTDGENGKSGIAVSPDGKSVYVANDVSNSVSMFTRDTATGELTASTTATVTGLIGAVNVAISHDGKSVYVTNGFISPAYVYMYSRNTDGALTSIGAPGYVPAIESPRGIVISPPDDTSVYVTNSSGLGTVSQYTRNITPGLNFGELSPITSQPWVTTGSSPLGIAVSPDGKSVYVDTSGNKLYQYNRNTTTGTTSPMSSPYLNNTGSYGEIAISRYGESVYDTDVYSGGGGLAQISRNTTTGLLSFLSAPKWADTTDAPQAVVISPDDTSVYVAGYGNLTGFNIEQLDRNTAPGPNLGRLTPMSTATVAATSSSDIAISPDGKSVYVTHYDANYISQFKVLNMELATTIKSRGYNTPYNTSSFDCANTSPRRVERGLKVSY